jgi:hypothetical protein
MIQPLRIFIFSRALFSDWWKPRSEPLMAASGTLKLHETGGAALSPTVSYGLEALGLVDGTCESGDRHVGSS